MNFRTAYSTLRRRSSGCTSSRSPSGKTYLAKHTTRTVRAKVKAIRYRIDVNTFAHVPAQQLEMNDIAEVEFETSLPIFFDTYDENRLTGSMILIEPLSNATVGAVMIDRALEKAPPARTSCPASSTFPGRAGAGAGSRREILARGERVVMLDDEHIAAHRLCCRHSRRRACGRDRYFGERQHLCSELQAIRRFIAEESLCFPANLTKNDAEAASHVLKEIGAQS